ncbi:MAG: hypothetical protein JPMHGGIA_02687 [Saprospiraceae bacterium]|nr:hypothetical protein [Saprospiraceae bacterium]
MRMLIFLLLVSLNPLYSQNLQRSVLGNCGSSDANGVISLDWTLGEPVSGLIKSGISLNQGFHQTLLMITRLDPSSGRKHFFDVYPNPTHSEVHIKSAETGPHNYQVFDGHGKMISQGILNNAAKIEMQSFETGLYILKIFTKSNIVQIFRIEKVQSF